MDTEADIYCRQSRPHWRSRLRHHREPQRARRAYRSRARFVQVGDIHWQLCMPSNLLCDGLSALGW